MPRSSLVGFLAIQVNWAMKKRRGTIQTLTISLLMLMVTENKRTRPIFSDAALQEAQEAFGVDYVYDEFYKCDQEDCNEEEYVDEDDEYDKDEIEERGQKYFEKAFVVNCIELVIKQVIFRKSWS
ncbi:hypothetical protein WA026_021674 [Henosepilachna vigintioctopunctata]|uniref:Uncharacterized protein n=1 Tax=Henosepilachna vigintioctopunctata TaxID=420089 RepID=A0AAW1UCM6_9CUCU